MQGPRAWTVGGAAACAAALLGGCAGLVGPVGPDGGSDSGAGGASDATAFNAPASDAGTPYIMPGTDAGALPVGPPPCVEGDFNGVDPVTGNCFMYFTTPATWPAAQAACATLGVTAHLATSANDDENAVMAQLAGLQDVFVGGTDSALENTYVWITAEPMTYVNWRIGEPNDSNGEDCMIIEGDNAGLWDDRDCLNTYSYLCERE